jgi:short-subunit dehydrogenase
MSTSKGTALITGASAGIGVEFARVFAENGYDLILVARSEHKLRNLAKELLSLHGIKCTVIASDLGQPTAAQMLFDEVVRQGLQVDVLVNNAGLLHEGPFSDTAISAHMQLLQVNIIACTVLAHLFLKPMLDRGAGRVLNVASTSAFQPLPQLSTYAASKAYLLSLSEALAIETRDSGVTVTALCPGFTNTGMIAKDGGKKTMSVPFIRNMEPAEVAREGFNACISGDPLKINGIANQLLVELGRYQPRPIRRWLSMMVAKKGF